MTDVKKPKFLIFSMLTTFVVKVIFKFFKLDIYAFIVVLIIIRCMESYVVFTPLGKYF